MSAPSRAARARLHPALATHQRRIQAAIAELHATNDALLIAALGLSVALKQGIVEPDDVHELLRVIHMHLKQTIADAERAVLRQEDAA